jgi:hypothetical protein
VTFFAAPLALDKASAHMKRSPASEVGQGEGRLPVAAVHRPKECEEGLILADRKELAVA